MSEHTDSTAGGNGKSSTEPANAEQHATDDDHVNPIDFTGEVQTTNDLPSQATLTKISSYTVLDADGKSHSFKSLYAGPNVARRVLIIFVRHFFCGNCQEYLRTLSASITPEALLALPVSTFVAIVGCGDPRLIPHYVAETSCPFPVYADPARRLYAELGMVRTLALGPWPAYMQNQGVARTTVSGIVQGLRQVRTGLALKMGDQKQVGGEFLFEPASMDLATPIATPMDENRAPLDGQADGRAVEEKRVTWCHRMRTTRDHAEIPELMEVLGLEVGKGSPTKDGKKWQEALKTKKGTGTSLAGQMSKRSDDAKRVQDE